MTTLPKKEGTKQLISTA